MRVIVARLEGPSLGDVVAVARRGARVELGAESRERISASRRCVERAAGGENRVYGVTTGFGALATTRVSVSERRELQHSLLRSHAVGTGAFVEPEVVRAMLMIRAKTLAMGYSGVRLELVEALVDMLNSGLVPAVPEHGSLGASGDLAPLAHVGLALIGEGERAADAAAAGLPPIPLRAKEG